MKLNARKIVMLFLALLVVLIIFIVYYFNEIQQDYWEEQRIAKQIAGSQLNMVSFDDIQLYSGEQAYQVVFGKNDNDQELIVWVHDMQVTNYVYANEGLSKDEILAQVTRKHPDATIVRAIPGIQDDQIVWEVFYKLKTEQGIRPYYDYYRFSDGAWLDTYVLAIKK